MLTRAVECVPQSVEIWLALARLSTYADAQVLSVKISFRLNEHRIAIVMLESTE
jgi:hypothetical protein